MDRDSAVIGLGFNWRLNDATTLQLDYQGQIGNDVSDHGAQGQLNYRF